MSDAGVHVNRLVAKATEVPIESVVLVCAIIGVKGRVLIGFRSALAIVKGALIIGVLIAHFGARSSRHSLNEVANRTRST